MEIFNEDCLEKIKDIPDKSIDLIFCDLPYGQTSCKWDCKIDLNLFWEHVMRIKKLRTPIFFTTTTKFGVELITTAPKKCPFRYDIVWCKSASTGFLSARKQPLRKHEMIYVFYEKLPFYDLSSHTHKFLKYDVNVIKNGTTYNTENRKKPLIREPPGKYDPPLPTSVMGCYGEKVPNSEAKYGQKCERQYDPPLPVSIGKEQKMTKDFTPNKNGNIYDCPDNQEFSGRNGQARYEPPLPNSMLEVKTTRGKHSTEKPVALMEWILKYYSKEGDTVLDPTMGSGSTGIACKNMNRKFIGIELDNEIFNVAKNRLS